MGLEEVDRRRKGPDGGLAEPRIVREGGRFGQEAHPSLFEQSQGGGVVDVTECIHVPPAQRDLGVEDRHGRQSRVSLRYVARCGRAASGPSRSTLFLSYESKLPSNQNHCESPS